MAANRTGPSARERRFVTAVVVIVAAAAMLGAWWSSRPAAAPEARRETASSAAPTPTGQPAVPKGTELDLLALTQTQRDAQNTALKAAGQGLAPPPLPDSRPETLLLRQWVGQAPPRPEKPAAMSEAARLGALIFVDRSLSASGRQSCASCHEASLGFSSPFDDATAPGGSDMMASGTRVPQPLRYAALNPEPQFTVEETPEADGGGLEAAGGFFWDGRASSLQDQAQQPFLAANEMANRNASEVLARLVKTPYYARLQALYGASSMADPDQALASVGQALMQFQLESPSFAPFSSRFDDYLRGSAQLTPAQQRGLMLFNNPAKGNCIACHTSVPSANRPLPLFTDFTYDALGVPRNPQIAANRNPAHFDLGLCDAHPPSAGSVMNGLCGAFKVPSLRNVAVRRHFFHNGRFDNLRTVLEFYVQRDTHPERWYPRDAAGKIQLFDDLPAPYKANVNRTEVPYNRKPGQAPALDAHEIDDLLSFLSTLTDADLTAQAQQNLARQGIRPQ
ncbi:cytochrome-c peroxidase [Amphibiibacter pelophylacis]|uniref:Cytochrome c peroxidase n=1 Tax=Amphibiibacter pelophylacis TaxID=1799477 RepID=A0ACC6NZY0_9BURK